MSYVIKVSPNDGAGTTHIFFVKRLYAWTQSPFLTVEPLSGSRNDLIHPQNWLQLAIINMDNGNSFIPHVHEDRVVITDYTRTQEAWVVLNGSVESLLYDMEGNFIIRGTLLPGDIVVTLMGGHNYIALNDSTLVAEFKSGPYDPSLDKKRLQ